MMKRISILIVISMLLALCFGCNADDGVTSSADITKVPFTVKIQTKGEMALSEIEIRIYDKENQNDLIWAGETDKNGCVNFKAVKENTYIAKLDNIPKGYKCDESYIISEDSFISLETSVTDDFFTNTYGRGDISGDFSLLDINGNNYKLSELLKTKKAVVLNFWFIGCAPCRMEFPYLQNAYAKYKDDIELIAINPLDGNNTTVSEYANQLGLEFPMSADIQNWIGSLNVTSYPTTVIIDRYGMISMIHSGAVTEDGVFEKIFEYYVSDNYVQSVVRNIGDIK